MRTAFIQELIREARINPNLFLVVGDLGYSVVEPFADEFPGRFLNAGVAEQNMTSVAAGLASEGYHVFTYSIANFPTLRCLEQVRNDVCYHNLPVTVVAVGGGVAYGNLGYSHHAVQDLAVMRSLPNITVLSPADPGEAAEGVQFLCAHPGPSYLRLGKAGEKELHGIRGLDHGPLAIRRAKGSVALVATGSVLAIALQAAEQFEEEHKGEIAVYSCPWLKPVTSGFFRDLWRHRYLVTLEEHVVAGGFGDLVRSLSPEGTKVTALGLSEAHPDTVGSQQYLRERSQLSVDGVLHVLRAITC